jgi:hypothetical protein
LRYSIKRSHNRRENRTENTEHPLEDQEQGHRYILKLEKQNAAAHRENSKNKTLTIETTKGVDGLPPANIKTVEDLLFWQYAKIIAQSAGFSKKDYGFVCNRFKQLKQGKISWNQLREYLKERQTSECIYCGNQTDLTLEHILPRCYCGPNYEKNVVWVCKSCNSKKGAKRLYEYYVAVGGLKAAKYDVPRIAEGKYLKFAYEVLATNNMLSMQIADITSTVCPECDLKPVCIQEDTKGKLSTLCIDGLLTLCFKKA